MAIDKTYQELIDQLNKKKKEVLSRFTATKKKAREISSFDGDDADRAGNAEDREMVFAMGSRDQQELMAIEGALKSISLGTYGACGECGKKITKKRLKILPFVKYCTDCQADIELEAKRENAMK